MADKKLWEQTELTQAEENNALMAIVSADDASGRWRWKKIGKFFASLHRKNPLEVVWDDTTIFEDYTSPPQFSRASTTTIFTTTTHNLDIRQGANRHSFADGYTHFVFYVNNDSTPDPRRDTKFTVIAPEITESSETSPARALSVPGDTSFILAITEVSNTSFKTGFAIYGTTDGSNTDSGVFLTKIVGYKQIIRPSSL